MPGSAAPLEPAPSHHFRRIPELDGLRGCAILLVLCWHYVAMHIPGWLHRHEGSRFGAAWPLLGLTWSGVDLFFVLSGFLIGGILLDQREQPAYFRTFYLRRLLRIVPLYYLWLLLSRGLAALPLASPGFFWLAADPFPGWTYAACLQNFWMAAENRFGPNLLGITWSLAVEEQFYLLLPLVVRFVPPRGLPYLLIPLILAAPALRLFLGRGAAEAPLAAYVLLPCRADALLLGVLAAYGLRYQEKRLNSRYGRGLLHLLLGLCATGVLAIAMKASPTITSRMMSVGGHSLLAVGYTCLLLLVVLERAGPIAGLMRLAPLRTLGTLAYGLYLFHQGVAGMLHMLLRHQEPQLRTPADGLVMLGALAVTLGLACLSWRWLERPCIALGHSFRYDGRRSGPTATPGPAGE